MSGRIKEIELRDLLYGEGIRVLRLEEGISPGQFFGGDRYSVQLSQLFVENVADGLLAQFGQHLEPAICVVRDVDGHLHGFIVVQESELRYP